VSSIYSWGLAYGLNSKIIKDQASVSRVGKKGRGSFCAVGRASLDLRLAGFGGPKKGENKDLDIGTERLEVRGGSREEAGSQKVKGAI